MSAILLLPTIEFIYRFLESKSQPFVMEVPALVPVQKRKEEEVPKPQILPVEDRIVGEKLKHDVLCGICCLVLTHPRQCLSGHVYCGDCVAKCIVKAMDCPICRREMSEETVARNLYLEEYCKLIPVHCQYHYEGSCDELGEPSNKRAEDGCPEEVALQDLESHERECKFAWIRCPFTYKTADSVHTLRKNQWVNHKEICEFRPSICRYCDRSHPSNSLEVSFNLSFD